MTSLETVVGRLRSGGFDPRSAGPERWESRCPAHNGTRRNLSIARGTNGSVLLHCHHNADHGTATCRAEDILGAIGLGWADLYDDRDGARPGTNRPTAGKSRPRRSFGSIAQAVASVAAGMRPAPVASGSWTCRDAGGEPVMAVGRFDLADGSKTYRPFHRLADGTWGMGDPPGALPLYRLNELLRADVALVLEGERCADAASATGWAATTSAHGAGGPERTDWTPLAGKTVVILPDHDAPGEGYALSVLRLLRELDPRPRVKVVRLGGLAEGEDFVDWSAREVGDAPAGEAAELLRLRLIAECDTVRPVDLEAVHVEPARLESTHRDSTIPDSTIPDSTNLESTDLESPNLESESEPDPIIPAPDWPALPEEAAFHGVAGAIVRLIAPSTEADPMALLLQLLAGLGNAIGRGVWVVADGQHHHANELLCCVGDTSRARKGTSWKRLRPVLSLADPAWSDSRITAGLSSGEGLIWEIRDPIAASDAPGRDPRAADPGVADKRLLVVESELGNVLRILAREGNTLSAVLRMAWDGDDLRTMTKTSPARASRPHMSLIGHITQQELARYLSAVEVFNGLGNRILWACVRRSNILPFGGSCDEAQLARLADTLAAAVARARDLGPVGWTQAGRELWEAEYPALTPDRPGLGGAITSRAEAHVLRLALILTALDRQTAIDDAQLHAALALWRYCDRSAAHLFRGSLGDHDADAILAALRARPRGMTRTAISLEVFQRNRPATAIRRALGVLLKYHLARMETDPATSQPRWLATPQAGGPTNCTNSTNPTNPPAPVPAGHS